MFYTTPSGKRLVQESLEPMFYPNYSTWGFYKVNRWRKGFDKFIRRCIESGLLDHWKFKTWIEMEKKQRGLRKPVVYKDISPISPLTWDDTQGAFYLVGMGITVSITIFFKEFFSEKLKVHTYCTACFHVWKINPEFRQSNRETNEDLVSFLLSLIFSRSKVIVYPWKIYLMSRR